MGFSDFFADLGQARVPAPPPPPREQEWRTTLKRQLALAATLWDEAADAAVDGQRAEVEALLASADCVTSASRKAMERVLACAEQKKADADRAAGLPSTLEEARTRSGIDTAPK